ncbi:MAG: hypothetical protein QOJ29_4898 [Thermoleophilaceae bacterium]|nr:hypothetical protein [Thermoleophilaceae bacterium]
MTRLAVRTVAVAASLALAVPALAATKHGVTPLSPMANATVKAGKAFTFKARAKGGGTVWLHVCKSKKKAKDGTICSTALIAQMKKKNGVYQHKTKTYTFSSYWLNTPGTYYWQVHRIKCEGSTSDCRQEGPILKFKVA